MMSGSGYDACSTLVIGAASGMGRAATEMLSAQGADVRTVDLRTHDVDVTDHLSIDLREPGAAVAVAEWAPADLDAVFLCAGLPQTYPAAEVVSVNFVATRALIEQLTPRTRRGGSITAIVSMTYGWERTAALVGDLVATIDEAAARAWLDDNVEALGDPYIASKFALTAWTLGRAASTMSDRGVRLNLLGPGSTETPMYRHFEEAVGAEMLAMTTAVVGRASTVEEQAGALLFLGHPANTYMVGALLLNDGGMSATMASGSFDRAHRKSIESRS
jgi:NAD(P)-dependent dehydrogenase (short-subunit alcohol dehydrogenase family)